MFWSSRHLLPSIGDRHAILPKKFQICHARIKLPHMWLGLWKRILSLRQWASFHRMEFSWVQAKLALRAIGSCGFQIKKIEFSMAQLGVRRLRTIDSHFSYKVSKGWRIVPEMDQSDGHPHSSNLSVENKHTRTGTIREKKQKG